MKSLTRNESGIALVTAILVLMLVSGLAAGMFAALLANQRSHATDRDQSVAYAAAHAGLEKLTAGLGGLFTTDFSPNAGQIALVDATPPAIAGFTYTAPGGAAGSGYDITFTPIPVGQPFAGDPQALANTDITTGPFEGFKGLITKYELTVTARSTTGNSEVRLRRELQTVAVPVFQFGIFGEKSLGFHAGPNFDFGGRVHTNQSLFIANGNPNTLTFRDKITALNQVVRNRLSNGRTIGDTGHTGNVSIPTVIGGAPATYRLLDDDESSGRITSPCIGAPATTDSNCWTGWKNLSEVTYHANVRTEATGAKRLDLPLTSAGLGPIELIKRPVVNSNENVAQPLIFGQRYYAQASLRILLSDRAADITNLPGIAPGAPLDLGAVGGPAGYVPQAGPPFRPPVALSPGTQNETFDAADGTPLTRVRDFPNAGEIRFQTSAPTPPALAWANANVPAWLRWPGGVTALARVGAFNLPCTGFAPNQLLGCDTAVVLNRHPAYAVNTVVTITLGDGTTVNVNTSALAAANSATIEVNGFNPAMRYVATRHFFVGEDPVVCTGISRQPANTDSAANVLTGCTAPAAPAGLAVSDPVYSGATTTVNTPLLSGFIKVERQAAPVGVAPGVWTDVTLEFLNYGFAGPNDQGDPCNDPTPNAILRFMRLRDNGYAANLCVDGTTGAADYGNSLNGTDYWPNMLYDAREGNTRVQNVNTGGLHMAGLFSYVALDADNLRQWLAATGAYAAGTGAQAWNNNGYIIYFSDRRGDHDETAAIADIETGEFGNEDFLNPGAAVWAKTNVLETGENVNESVAAGVETIQMYGETPSVVAGVVPATAVANMGFEASQRPWSVVPRLWSGRGRMARPVLFRRALKIVRGGLNQLPTSGINFSSENPVYIQGNFNATAASVVAEPNVPAAVIGDAITLLSGAFRDSSTFLFPNDMNNRNATTTGYRFAMVTGKALMYPNPAWADAAGDEEMGSDGGVHNFMRMLEDWNGQTLRYRGSMVSLFFSRQAIGIYRADGNIYSPPNRAYNFDTDFLSPPLLPPGTPMFRDINTLKFRQILRPNQ